MKWFSHDPGGDNFRICGDEESAKAAAQEALEWYREQAGCDGWYDEVESVCWGRVLGWIEETERRPYTEDDGPGNFDEYVDYALVSDNQNDTLRSRLAAVEAQRDELVEAMTEFMQSESDVYDYTRRYRARQAVCRALANAKEEPCEDRS